MVGSVWSPYELLYGYTKDRPEGKIVPWRKKSAKTERFWAEEFNVDARIHGFRYTRKW